MWPERPRIATGNSTPEQGLDGINRLRTATFKTRRSTLSAPFNKYDNVLFAVLLPPCYARFGRALKQEREELERRANKYTLPYFIVARAKMILLAEQGLSNDAIANSLSTRREIVSRWRKRFFEKRLGGLEDFPRPGRPRVFSPRAGRAR